MISYMRALPLVDPPDAKENTLCECPHFKINMSTFWTCNGTILQQYECHHF